MSREYARRSRGGGNLPLIIAIIGTVIVIAVILYFVLGGGGNSPFGAKETETPYISPAPETSTPTPGPSLTTTPTQSLIIVSPAVESPSAVIATQAPTPTPAPSYPDAKVWANTLLVHEGASLDSAVIGKTHHGERYKVWEEAYHFVKIQMTSGAFGWIHTDYVVRGDAALPAAPTSEPKPSFMSKAEFVSTNKIRVTFTENVWGNSGKTDNVSATVFTVKEGSTERSITDISDCAGGTFVDLTISSTSGGTITVSIDKNGVYNSDAEGTPAGSVTIGSSSDTTKPTVTGNSMAAKVITFTFSEEVLGEGAVKDFFSVYSENFDASTMDYSAGLSTNKITITINSAIVDGEQVTVKILASKIKDTASPANYCDAGTYNFTYDDGT